MPESNDLNDSLSDNSNSFVSVESHSAIDDTSDECDIFTFSSKGLHLCNLNIRHILPKIDEIRLLLSNNNSPDIFGICESFLGTHHPDSLISIGPRQANLVLIAYASSEGSGEPAHLRSLTRTSAARSYKQWVKRNLQTESQIPGPSEWLGMRS